MARQNENAIFTTGILQDQAFGGLAVMADGSRRRELEKTAHEMFKAFEGRVLPFNTDAASAFAELYAMRRWVTSPLGSARAVNPHSL
jgi:hypothetical protein